MENDRSGIQAVQLTLDILEELANAQQELGVSELAQRLSSSKGTIYRHLQTLVNRSYLSQNPTSQRYRFGIQSHLLGEAARNGLDLVSIGTEVLDRLQAATGQTAVLSGLSGRSIVVLNTIRGPSALDIGVKPGSELPLHASAQGRVALAFARRSMMPALRRKPLEAMTSKTVTDVDALEDIVATARKNGWASASEEMVLGVSGIAAPVFDASGECIASVAIVGSIQFVTDPPDRELVANVLKHADNLSLALGHREGVASTKHR